MYVTVLEKVARRYAPSRTLSFDVVHVFAALQMMWNTGRASRNALCSALCLGEATVKALVKHLKMQGLVETSNCGMKMTDKGKGLCAGLLSAIPAEMSLPKC